MTLFITGNQSKWQEVATLLADLDIRTRKLALPGYADLGLAERVRARARAAYELVKEPCFTELSQLKLDGVGTMSGAQFKRALESEGAAGLASKWGGLRGEVRVAVAYCFGAEPDALVHFEGWSEGEFLAEPDKLAKGTGYGWDPLWRPDGYRKSLAAMTRAKAVVNMRRRAYLALGHRLRGASEGGAYEGHVTVGTDSAKQVESFLVRCDELGSKAIVIQLPRGKVASQPMTVSYHHGTRAQALDELFALAKTLSESGFEVTRVKLEALGTNTDIPRDDASALAEPKNYFEFHLKLLLNAGYDDAQLIERIQAHGAHLSRNAIKVRPDGRSERFVTLRARGCGAREAERAFAALITSVEALDLPIVKRIREYTVYDSNESLDHGWL